MDSREVSLQITENQTQFAPTPDGDGVETNPGVEIVPAPASRFRQWPLGSFALWLVVAAPLIAMTTGNMPASDAVRWRWIVENIRNRASVDLAEDFRQDLTHWAGKGAWFKSWSLDPAGYAQPGELGLYIKSIPLDDYRMEFRGMVERKGLGFVYRAADFDNYYAGRIAVVKGGPIPEVVLERYAVIDGVAGPKTKIRLPFPVRVDTLYDVQVEAQGDHFVTRINNRFVDSFDDSRLRSGGVGFFASRGDTGRICWLRVVRNNDLIGALCLLLSPGSGHLGSGRS